MISLESKETTSLVDLMAVSPVLQCEELVMTLMIFTTCYLEKKLGSPELNYKPVPWSVGSQSEALNYWYRLLECLYISSSFTGCAGTVLLQNLVTRYRMQGVINGGKGSLKSNLAKEDLRKQRDDLTGFRFYVVYPTVISTFNCKEVEALNHDLDENWRLVYLPESITSSNSSRNQAEHQPAVVPVTMASQHQFQLIPGQMPGWAHNVWRPSVKHVQPEQFSLHALQNQPPKLPVEVHAPYKPKGNDQVAFRPRDLCWKYACRVPNGKTYNVQCILCGKVVCNISRMKEHLACTGRTTSCPRATDDIREEIADYLLLKKNPRFNGASSSAGRDAPWPQCLT